MTFSIRGFIGTSALARGNRSFEHFLSAGRYVKSALLQEFEDGYHGFLMQHQYPFCALHLNFAPGGIDVNVHPTKQEVRIEDGPGGSGGPLPSCGPQTFPERGHRSGGDLRALEPAPVPKADTKIPKAPEEPEELKAPKKPEAREGTGAL